MDREDGDKAEDQLDTLKDATTLYVGNLYVPSASAAIWVSVLTNPPHQFFLHYRRTDPRVIFQVSIPNCVTL